MRRGSASNEGFLDDHEHIQIHEKKLVDRFWENIRFIIIGVLVVIIIVLTACLAAEHRKNNDSNDATELCSTPQCIHLSSSLLENMNTNVDPCEDFYEYSCGNWAKNNPMPGDRTRYSAFGKISDRNQQAMKRILEDPKQSDSYDRIYTLYESCMNESNIESIGSTPIVSLWQSLEDGWSNEGEWDSASWTVLSNKLVFMFELNLNPFFGFYVSGDLESSTETIVYLTQTGLTLPDRDYYNATIDEDENLLALRKLIEQTLRLVDSSESDLENRARSIVSLEKLMAKKQMSNTDQRNITLTYNVLDVAGLEEIFSVLDWQNILDNTFQSLQGPKIVVETVDYLASLQSILTNSTKAQILDYLRWRILYSSLSSLSSDFRDAKFDYSKVVYGSKRQSDRWKTCVSSVYNSMSFMLGKLFVDNNFAGDSMKTISEMIQEITKTFKDNLNDISWMDELTKQRAREKADQVNKEKIGYPTWIYDADKMTEYYKGLEVTNQYFESIQSVDRWSWAKEVKKLGKPVDKTEWGMGPATVNAYYSPTNNEIVFPAGILQPIFFHDEYLKASNFGGIGSVIGHELTHGFDDQGSQFDGHGNKVNWWESETLSRYHEKTKCIEEQYGNFSLETSAGPENVNGKLTLGENIADNGGIHLSYLSFLNQKDGKDWRLPGLPDLTQDQLFFLGFSSVWCGTSTPEHLHQQLTTDPHSPTRFRVIGTLSNSKYFAEAFHCSASSTMNPKDKCVVW